MQDPPFWMWIAGFLLVLGPLVTLHELGHYLVGRLFGVKAEAFSIGFGRELAGWSDRRGTRWKLSAIPLGGYVQFAGDMNPASQPSEDWLKLPADERNKTFQSKPLWQRALIVFAGPATNIVIAVAIFAAFFMVFGRPVAANPEDSNVVQQIAADSSAARAGIRVGDRIVAIDGDRITDFQQIVQHVVLYPGKSIAVTIERDGDTLRLPVTIADVVEKDRFGNASRVGRLGISTPVTYEPVGFFAAVSLGARNCFEVTRMMVIGVGQIISGDRSTKELGGPIKIAKFSGEQLSLGPLAFAQLVALISINLAFINLLPIPALDGGHLAFYAAEAIRRKPASQRSQEWAFRTGIALVLALMLFVTINDIASLPIFGG